ncbi:magnesium/cobalt efflux protein [Thioclava sp. SK-1]|uniref:hemolysin family protein n=1 Tax=Thioclava sp. SK-1 TaxID=1889770 RepID=UPI0008264D83|nr:hemolysin family protein [Thioclava sp. SK-1]OCX66521.1 magnesium/cobalt efflux protein [Thioclava sp. SK-1]
MGHVADGGQSANAPAVEQEPGESIEPHSRGFFTRLFGQGASNDSDENDGEDDDEPRQEMTPNQARLPGLGNLRRMRVGDVSIPKVEIVAVPGDITREELVEVFREHGYSRVPVFRETLDTPLGLVHLKDLALEYGFGKTPEGGFDLSTILRPLLYVPPSMPIGVLLQKMQVQRIHMALVIDEYGGVDGLLTLEDLIEQVIGEIEDEHDEAEGGLWRLEKPGQWIVLARAPLSEFEAEIGMTLADAEEEQEIDSLGGVVFMQAGRVPARGEVIVAENGVEYEIVDADPRRIKRLRVRLPGVAPAE